jgi:hypothetical protein
MRPVRLLILVAMVFGGSAYADDSEKTARYLEGRIDRARRAFSLGPTLGVFGGLVTEGSEAEAGLSFGLGLYAYKIPIMPTPQMIRELVQERIKAKLADKVKGMVARGEPPPSPEDLERWGREIFEEVKAEILGERAPRPRLLEKPRFVLDLEGVYLFRSGNVQVRTTVGLGISVVTIGVTAVVGFGDGASFWVGPELGVRLLPGKGVRAPVVNVFLRADFSTTDREVRGDFLTLGARVLLDLI